MKFEHHYKCGCIEITDGYYTGLQNQCCLLTYNMDSPAELKCDRLNQYKMERKQNG